MDPHLQICLNQGIVSPATLAQLRPPAEDALRIPEVRELVQNETISSADLIRFNRLQSDALELLYVRDFIEQGVITIQDLHDFSWIQIDALELPHVRDFIEQGVITIQDLHDFRRPQIEALETPHIYQAIPQVITIEELKGYSGIEIQDIIRNGPPNADGTPNINYADSIHEASVHKAVSESATRLMSQYGHHLTGSGLDEIITKLTATVSQAAKDKPDLKHSAAERCIARITDPNLNFTDAHEHGSDISLRQLLALSFLAIQDDSKRVGSFDDALSMYIDGLYEIQRGDNLSNVGVDNHSPHDANICPAGSFNKLIEKLQGIHPACEIIFVTTEMAMLKLPVIVKDAVKKHLVSVKNVQGEEYTNDLVGRMTSHEEGGDYAVELVWDAIKGQVTTLMFDEFGSLYSNDTENANFLGLIESGQEVELRNLGELAADIESEPAHVADVVAAPAGEKESEPDHAVGGGGAAAGESESSRNRDPEILIMIKKIYRSKQKPLSNLFDQFLGRIDAIQNLPELLDELTRRAETGNRNSAPRQTLDELRNTADNGMLNGREVPSDVKERLADILGGQNAHRQHSPR